MFVEVEVESHRKTQAGGNGWNLSDDVFYVLLCVLWVLVVFVRFASHERLRA